MELLSGILFSDIDYLKMKIDKKFHWISYFFIALLFTIIGFVSSLYIPTNDVPKKIIIFIVTIGSLLTFLGVLILSFLIFTIIKLFLNLDISSKTIKDIALIGSVPLLLNNLFNTIMNGFFGVAPNGYVSLNYFFYSQNRFLNNFFQSINPFYIWSWILVSVLFYKFTSSQINNKSLPIIYTLMFFGIKVLLG